MFRKTPLAWLQLTREKIRLLVALAGISFADILMFMQMGFKDALFESSTRPHKTLQAELVLISPKSESLVAMQDFSWRRLYQALSVEGVEWVSPLYLGLINWKNPVTSRERSILVLGYDPSKPVFNMPEVNENASLLKIPDVVFFDRSSRAEFGPIAERLEQGKSTSAEVGGRRVKVRSLFNLGASFAADGNLITSDLNFIRIFSDRQLGQIDAGLINLKPGVDAEKVRLMIEAQLPEDVMVLTHEGFVEFEQSYWRDSTAIGFIFSLGTMMGFIVGIVIVYQIIYTDVANHLPEYATLKAMGYRDRYFLSLVFQEACYLAILGFLPSLPIVMFLYGLTRNATMLPVVMTLNRAIVVLILTLVMCIISGAIAVRKLQEADPADIF
ncbi:MAG: FtsX-like permease family protein [Oscillatoria sp. SIO1A7]|nr:FtsX-like permease family protein [Oscillatoria sp. SIO1A7]